jgi:hypothetical protein
MSESRPADLPKVRIDFLEAIEIGRTQRAGVGSRRPLELSTADDPVQPEPAHQPLHRAAGLRLAFSPQVLPDLPDIVHLALVVPRALDLVAQSHPGVPAVADARDRAAVFAARSIRILFPTASARRAHIPDASSSLEIPLSFP